MVDLLCQKTKSSFKERFFTNRGMTDRQTDRTKAQSKNERKVFWNECENELSCI